MCNLTNQFVVRLYPKKEENDDFVTLESIIAKRNTLKAQTLYNYIDSSKLYRNVVAKENRSTMNVTFITGNAELDAKFVAESTAAGLQALKGHKVLGGMRASIYNAMPLEGVEALIKFMKKFEAENS